MTKILPEVLDYLDRGEYRAAIAMLARRLDELVGATEPQQMSNGIVESLARIDEVLKEGEEMEVAPARDEDAPAMPAGTETGPVWEPPEAA